MPLTYVGELPLVEICSSSAAALVSASAGLSGALAPLALDLTAAIGLEASIGINPPDIGAAIDACVQLAENLNLGISLGSVDIDFQVAAVAELILELGPIVLALKAAISALAALQATLNTGGIFAYSYTGTGAAFGPAVSSLLAGGLPDGSPGGASVTGVLLGATSTTAWGALQSFFGPATSNAPGFTLTGALTLGEIAVVLFDLLAQLLLSLNLQLGGYQGQLTGALKVQAQLMLSPPSFTGNLAIVAQMKASLEAYLTPGAFVLPSVAITACTNIVEQLTELVASLTSQIAACVSLGVTLAIPGILGFTYSGTAAELGGDVESSIGIPGWPDGTPSSAQSNALIFLASQPAASAGLDLFFGGLTV